MDIFDRHDHTKPDAVGKAKGLSGYAAKHEVLLAVIRDRDWHDKSPATGLRRLFKY